MLSSARRTARAHRLIWRCSTTPVCTNNIPHTFLLQKVGIALEKTLPHAGTQQAAPKAETQKRNTDGRLKDIRLRQGRLEEAYLAGKWDLDRYSKRKDELDLELLEIQQDLNNVQQQTASKRAWRQSLQSLQAQPNIPIWLTETDSAEVNLALHLLLDNITVSAETIQLEFK